MIAIWLELNPHAPLVIPGVVPGINLAARSSAHGWLDPDDEHRDDDGRMSRAASCRRLRGAARLSVGLRRPGEQPGEGVLRIPLAGEDADHVARAGAGRENDDLT